MNLKNKIAIVAGGARDLGKACSLRLAAEGAKVVIGYHGSDQGAEETLREIHAAGGTAIAVKADLTQESGVARLVASSREAFGDAIDVLVFVTGGLVARKTMAQMDLGFWNQVMNLNMTSMFLCTQAVIPHMPEGSTIVTYSSQAARDGGGPGAIAYATAKGAVMSFTRGLAKELGPRIRVNAICAGMFDTTFHDTFTQDEVRSKVSASSLVKREGRPGEAASLTAFLASDESGFMTGNCVDINGGMLFS
ncbi:SDR family NAD(P)-dependent oxidoreductase [Marinobacterium rhizophilum]|uniref:SDR family oxidoreductase n=1 Tax=Marinobacterium rhizophilum TaxID=420402 RepID=A0ABY5HDM1_9GAMM|nr:SDR family oxidoreductase [Marinobacterium rhizophilum]UTW10426.1 SDR family oxidoreductase [Marinobacterium rhizophilum]